VFANIERCFKLDPRFGKLMVDVCKNGIRANTFLAQFLVHTELMRIEVVRDLFDFCFGQLGAHRMFDKKRLSLREDAVKLHHDGFREDPRLLLVLRSQRLLEPRDALLRNTHALAVATSSAFGTFRRTW
jgi:hypothetical protein